MKKRYGNLMTALAVGALLLFPGCKDDDESIFIDNVSIPTYKVSDGSNVKISGDGFMPADNIIFRVSGVGRSYATVVEYNEEYLVVKVPDDLSGEFDIMLERNGQTLIIGRMLVGKGPRINDISIPDPSELTSLVVISGEGFAEGDSIVVTAGGGTLYRLGAVVGTGNISFALPAGLSGEINMNVSREQILRELGSITIPQPPTVSSSMPPSEVAPYQQVMLTVTGLQTTDALMVMPQGTTEYYIPHDLDINGSTATFTMPCTKLYYDKADISVARNAARTVLGEVSVKAPALGDQAYGGTVFWLDQTGKHGFTFDVTNHQGCYFGPSVISTNTSNNRAVGTGYSNSQSIIAATREYRNLASEGDRFKTTLSCAEIADAIKIEKDGVVFDKWYIPSYEELVILYKYVHPTIGTGFTGGAYWSSSEISFNTAELLNIWAYEGAEVNSAGAQWKEWEYGSLVAIRNF